MNGLCVWQKGWHACAFVGSSLNFSQTTKPLHYRGGTTDSNTSCASLPHSLWPCCLSMISNMRFEVGCSPLQTPKPDACRPRSSSLGSMRHSKSLPTCRLWIEEHWCRPSHTQCSPGGIVGGETPRNRPQRTENRKQIMRTCPCFQCNCIVCVHTQRKERRNVRPRGTVLASFYVFVFPSPDVVLFVQVNPKKRHAPSPTWVPHRAAHIHSSECCCVSGST